MLKFRIATGRHRGSAFPLAVARLGAVFALGSACTLAIEHAARAPTEASATPPAHTDEPPKRSLTAVVHPAPGGPAAPPFSVVSVRSGPAGFIVGDDGRVLMPGATRGGFKLERIEPHRLVFSGPYRAELAW